MKTMAHQVVARDKNVAAPRGPKAVWLPAPPKAPARSAAEPLCSIITIISTKQTSTCSVTSTNVARQPMAMMATAINKEKAHLAHVGIANSNFWFGSSLPDFELILARRPHDQEGRLEIPNRSKRLGVQARAAHQRTIDLCLRHQALYVVGFDAATVEDPNR